MGDGAASVVLLSHPFRIMRGVARDRHPKQDYESLLREAEQRGWRITRGKGYFRCLCPCADKHWVRVVLTPSGSRTLLNTRKDFERCSCWKEAT